MTMIITSSSNTKAPTTTITTTNRHHHNHVASNGPTQHYQQQRHHQYHDNVTLQSNTNNNHHQNHHSEEACTSSSNNNTQVMTSNSPPSPSLLAASRGVSLSPVNFPSTYIPHPSNINNLLFFSKKSLLQQHHQYLQQQQQQQVSGRNFHIGTDLGVEKFDRKINGNQTTRSTLPSLNSPLNLQIGSTSGQGKSMGIISASEKCFSHKSTTNTSSAFSKRTPQLASSSSSTTTTILNNSSSSNNKIEPSSNNKIRGSFDTKIDSILSSIDNETSQKETSTAQTNAKKKSLSSIIFEEIANETNNKKRKFDETSSSSSSFQKVLDPPKKKKSIDEITAENMYESLLNKCRKNYIPQLQSINAITVAEEVTESSSSSTAVSCEVIPIISNEQLNLVVGNQLCSRAGPLTRQDKSIIRFIETNPINDFLLEFLENKKFTGF